MQTTRALRTAVLTLLLVGAAPEPAQGRTESTSQLLARAMDTAQRPLAERIEAFRHVLLARKRFDVNSFRALRRLAELHGKRGDLHTQAALASWSAVRMPKNERGTHKARVRLATGLRADGDLEAAARALRDVVARGGRIAPKAVATALRMLAEDAFDAGRYDDVRWAAREAASARVDAVTRMRLLGWQGLMLLRSGDTRRAKRLWEQCRRAYEDAQKRDPDAARKATRTWLDLPLTQALRDG